MAKSITRFTVEGHLYFDSAKDAIDQAKRMIYMNETAEKLAYESLESGKAITVSYGFCTVVINPPSAST